ncbi:hypothetical protein M8C21_014557 [Ambrosia artemisiifolia]|uniref:Membrane protein insertion efficiency factor YidD n=1 Tax=Ambrosia artemisiifolia TaxID=4212 RepID=A0AAD5CDN2_AMBAR|nr:hypothetical protein M8C21_014557 [Ambrosia artemisiifolia]
MAVVCFPPNSIINPNNEFLHKFPIPQKRRRSGLPSRCLRLSIVNEHGKESSNQSTSQGNGDEDLGVKVALSMLRFYKNEISPLLPKSCRYVPTCSEYSMIAYKKYGVAKGSILTVDQDLIPQDGLMNQVHQNNKQHCLNQRKVLVSKIRDDTAFSISKRLLLQCSRWLFFMSSVSVALVVLKAHLLDSYNL